jgi:hypothetical protein
MIRLLLAAVSCCGPLLDAESLVGREGAVLRLAQRGHAAWRAETGTAEPAVGAPRVPGRARAGPSHDAPSAHRQGHSCAARATARTSILPFERRALRCSSSWWGEGHARQPGDPATEMPTCRAVDEATAKAAGLPLREVPRTSSTASCAGSSICRSSSTTSSASPSPGPRLVHSACAELGRRIGQRRGWSTLPASGATGQVARGLAEVLVGTDPSDLIFISPKPGGRATLAVSSPSAASVHEQRRRRRSPRTAGSCRGRPCCRGNGGWRVARGRRARSASSR